MLKFEKLPKRSEVILTFRNAERFWNRRITVAFCLALLLHFFALSLFSIRSILLSLDGLSRHHVEAEIDSSAFFGGNVESNISKKIFEKYSFLIPDGSSQALIAYHQPKLKESIDSHQISPLNDSILDDNLEGLFSYFLPSSSPSLVFSYHGSLYGREILNSHIINELENKLSSLRDHLKTSIRYTVEVDDRQGKVVWWESNLLENNPLSMFLENFLKKLVFNSMPGGFMTKGEIEIHIK